MAGLTTHVLDTSIGKPAKDILIELFFLNNEVKNKILECTTNKDGRVDKPLLTNENFKFGNYSKWLSWISRCRFTKVT